MICPRCGTQLITGSRVCMACGQNVSYISNPSQAPASSAGTFPTAPTAPKLFFHTPGKAREAAAQTPSPASIPFVAPTQTKATPITPEASAPVKPVTPVTPVTPVKPVAPVTPAGSVITEFPKAKVEEVNNSKEPEKFVNTIPVAEPEAVNTAPAAEPEVVNTAPAAEPEVVEEPEIVETARTTDEIESIAKAKTGYSDKFIKKYANYWGQLATKLFDNEAYEFVFGGVLNLDGDDDRVAGCGITQKRIIVTTTQGTVSYPYDKTKSVSGSKGLVGAAVNIEIPRSKVKICVDKAYLDNIIKAIDAAIKKYHVD
uniref:PH domain-containing protein n=1 Tax=Eshraghiella crossota TaxID=45851 RepID=UPI004029A277